MTTHLAEKFMEEAGLELTKLLEEDKMQQVPLLVFANKQDHNDNKTNN